MDNADTGRTYDATAAAVAEKYGVSSRTVRRWCDTTDIPHRRTPGGPRFNLEEVDEWTRRRPALAR